VGVELSPRALGSGEGCTELRAEGLAASTPSTPRPGPGPCEIVLICVVLQQGNQFDVSIVAQVTFEGNLALVLTAQRSVALPWLPLEVILSVLRPDSGSSPPELSGPSPVAWWARVFTSVPLVKTAHLEVKGAGLTDQHLEDFSAAETSCGPHEAFFLCESFYCP
jgi:hypothetical protein